MEADHVYLAFTIKILDKINMWSNKPGCLKVFKDSYALLIIVSSTIAIFADFFLQFYDKEAHFTSIIESLIGGSALASVVYVAICFIVKKQEIKLLINSIKVFEKFLPKEEIETAETSAAFYTKFFILYGIVGNGLYDILPFFTSGDCMKYRTKHMMKYGIACKVLVRYVLPFKYDYSPYYELVILEQVVVANLGTTVVMTLTMLVCGILTHLSANLQHLRQMIKDISTFQGSALETHVNRCVKYHTAIIEVSDRTNDAFSVMMLVHITWTSFIISVLGFEIIMENNFWKSLRFVMHLGGWLGMLYLVCFYGQVLMNKSTDIAEAVYETNWYEAPPIIRKSLVLILLRSQRPLTLKAAGVNVMCLATFIGVLYSAYSYFTLLLKIKP